MYVHVLLCYFIQKQASQQATSVVVEGLLWVPLYYRQMTVQTQPEVVQHLTVIISTTRIIYLSMTHGEGLTERKQKFSYYRPFALCNAVIVQLYRFSQEQIQDIQRGRLVHIFLMVPKLHCSNSHPLLSSCVIV